MGAQNLLEKRGLGDKLNDIKGHRLNNLQSASNERKEPGQV